MRGKRLACAALGLILAAALAAPALAADDVKSFSDVDGSHWAYAAVMEMTRRGLFNGTSVPVNGVGTFSPGRTMSRAEFLAVAVRVLWGEELAARPVGDHWYTAGYELALEKGLVERGDYFANVDEVMNKPCNRQEAAMILTRAMEQRGEEVNTAFTGHRIPDYESVGTYYRPYVKAAYAGGLITGIDSRGTFDPLGTLTRAQGAAVLQRLAEPSVRRPMAESLPDDAKVGDHYPGCDFLTVLEVRSYSHNGEERRGFTLCDERTGVEYGCGGIRNGKYMDGLLQDVAWKKINRVPPYNQTWVEGQPHAIPQVGDTVIKADGTRVVLSMYTLPNGQKILGLYQGVDIATGIMTETGATLTPGSSSWTDLTVLIKDPQTGECYSASQWTDIRCQIGGDLDRRYVGDYDGEISDIWFQWDAQIESWVWIGPDHAK